MSLWPARLTVIDGMGTLTCMRLIRAITQEAPPRRARGAARVRDVASDGRTSIVSLGASQTGIVVRGAPDEDLARLAVTGLRRIHHVYIDTARGDAICTLVGSGRSPVRRRVPVGAALALASQGVPTYIPRAAGA